METDDSEKKEEAEAKDEGDEDYSEVMNDPAFLQSVLQGLPGVDPESDDISSAVEQLTQAQKKDTKKKDDN